MKRILLVAIAIALVPFSVQFLNAHSHEDGKLCEGIVPENDLYIPVDAVQQGGLDEKAFNKVLDKAEKHYAPVIKAKGGTLNLIRKWDDGTVNAYAQRQGSVYVVSMFGGLARHKTVTEDGFLLVACHEIGHHIGGAPKKGFLSSWASNEGQADYWGTMKCFKRVLENEDNVDIVDNMTVDKVAKATCTANYSSPNDIAICIRGAMGGMSLANLFRALRNLSTPLKFETPDTSEVTRTNHNHPAPQCRLDTYYQGALCNVGYQKEVDSRDEKVGTCNRANKDKSGLRPLCWFKPSSGGTDFPWPIEQNDGTIVH